MGDDVDERALDGVGEAIDDTALAGEVAEHEHANQWSGRGQQQRAEAKRNQRKEDFLALGNIAELHHLRFPLGLRGQQPHDRRLDDGHQRHVGISCNGNRAKQSGRKFAGEKNRGGGRPRHPMMPMDAASRREKSMPGIALSASAPSRVAKNAELRSATEQGGFRIRQ